MNNQDRELVPDSVFKLHIRDIPEYILQTIGNLLVWSGHFRPLHIFVRICLLPPLIVFWLAGISISFPGVTLRKASAHHYVKRFRFPLIWPLIFIGLLTYQYWNWLPVVSGVFVFSLGVLLIWFVLATVIFQVPSNAFSITGSLAIALFSVGVLIFVIFFSRILSALQSFLSQTLYSPLGQEYYSGITFIILFGIFSFIFFRFAVGKERVCSTGKQLRDLIGLRDPLIANAVSILFTLRGFKVLAKSMNDTLLVLGGVGVLLLFVSVLIAHFNNTLDQKENIEPQKDSILIPDGVVVKPQQHPIRFSDKIAFLCYLGSWLVVIWSVLLYIY